MSCKLQRVFWNDSSFQNKQIPVRAGLPASRSVVKSDKITCLQRSGSWTGGWPLPKSV